MRRRKDSMKFMVGSGQKLTSNLPRLAQDAESIDAETVQVDTQAAVETLQALQSQIEDVSCRQKLRPANFPANSQVDEPGRHGERSSSNSSRSRFQRRGP